MNRLLLIAASLTAIAGMVACDDKNDASETPGGVLVGDNISLVIDNSFTIEARSMRNNRIQSRTTTQLLGAIEADDYGKLNADFVAEMFPSNMLDTVDMSIENIDSVKLQLVFQRGGFVGDSLAPIGVEVYPLNRQLPYPIFSDFDPAGYYNSSVRLGSGVFTAAGIGVNDTVAAGSYRYAYITLPLQFGRELYQHYLDDPLTFNDPQKFAEWFPGFYVHHTFGSGRVTRISDTRVIMYYHKIRDLNNANGELVRDSLTRHYAYYMAAAPEVVSNSQIDMQLSPTVTGMVNQGRVVVVSPAGLDAEITFPIREAINTYRTQTQGAISVVNNLSFSLPADSIPTGRGIGPSPYLLMVLSKEKDEFFANNKLPDNVTSFLGTFNADSMKYTFSDMRGYMMKMLDKEELTADDYTFTLTPVAMVTESAGSYYNSSSSTLSGITPMVALPSLMELLPARAKLALTFSRQTLR